MADVTPDPIMRIALGFMAAKHLFVASAVGLFEALNGGPATLDELASKCGVPRRTLGISADPGRDPASIEITQFALAEDPDRVKRLNEMGVARVVPMFPPERADKVLPIVDRWTKIMRQVNG